MKKAFILSVIVAAISGCSSIKNADSRAVTLSGRISTLGTTTFQYGTHSIQADKKMYALKSSKVDLNNYLDKKVTLKGSKVPGYPLEGGPELIEVSEVSPK